MGISINRRPIETGIKDFLSGVVGTMMSLGGSIMASYNDIKFLEEKNPSEQSQLSILLSKKIFESRVERQDEKESPKTEKSSMKTSIVSLIMSWKMDIMHL
ncbi:hypothetical protein Tco_1421579 [Tanacetum coccineum]